MYNCGSDFSGRILSKELLNRLNIERSQKAMEEGSKLLENYLKLSLLMGLSCLAKERCIPVTIPIYWIHQHKYMVRQERFEGKYTIRLTWALNAVTLTTLNAYGSRLKNFLLYTDGNK
jgi:hypothetical protein